MRNCHTKNAVHLLFHRVLSHTKTSNVLKSARTCTLTSYSVSFAADRIQVERCGQQMYQRTLPASPPILLQPRRQRYHCGRCLKTTQQTVSLQDPRQWRSARYDRTCIFMPPRR